MANQEQLSTTAQNTPTLFLYSLSLSLSRTITQTNPTVITPLDTTLGHYLAHQLVQIGVTDIFSIPGDSACVVTFTGGAWIDNEA